MHQHIWSFCGAPGCKDKPHHPNTENLVSPQLTQEDVGAYFVDKATGGDTDPDTYVVLPCHQDPCPNPKGFWLYIWPSDHLTSTFRPNHFDPGFVVDDDTWAKGES